MEICLEGLLRSKPLLNLRLVRASFPILDGGRFSKARITREYTQVIHGSLALQANRAPPSTHLDSGESGNTCKAG
jgi:hypothetical protein